MTYNRYKRNVGYGDQTYRWCEWRGIWTWVRDDECPQCPDAEMCGPIFPDQQQVRSLMEELPE